MTADDNEASRNPQQRAFNQLAQPDGAAQPGGGRQPAAASRMFRAILAQRVDQDVRIGEE